MKEKIKQYVGFFISKTILFIFIVLMIGIFNAFFGKPNSLVAVTTVILMLVLMGDDLMLHPIKNFLRLLGLNYFLAFAAFFSTVNPFVGLILNFGTMLFLGYYFNYELKKPLNMVIGLHYILMLTSPITITEMPLRLGCLTAGTVLILISQVILNNKSLVKKRNKMFSNLCHLLREKMELIKYQESIDQISLDIDDQINKFKLLLDQSGRTTTGFTPCGKNTIKLLACLEKLNQVIDNQYIEDKELDHPDAYKAIITAIEQIDSSILPAKCFDFPETKKLCRVCKEELDKYHQAEKEKDIKENSLNKEFKEIEISKNEFDPDSVQTAYGLRLGIVVALTFFLIQVTGVENGKWLVYTCFALIQPYSEFTLMKSKKRLVGTIIGAIIVTILFTLIQEPQGRTLLLILAGYLMSFFKDYRNVVVLATISAIASASIYVVDMGPLVAERALYVALGIIVTIIANKFLWPRKYADEAENLFDIESDAVKAFVAEAKLPTEKQNRSLICLLYLVPSLIQQRVEFVGNNILVVDKEILYEYKNTILDLYLEFLPFGENDEEGTTTYERLTKDLEAEITKLTKRKKSKSQLFNFIAVQK